MVYFLILFLSVLIYMIATILDKKTKCSFTKIMKTLSVILFGVYMARLFSQDAITKTFNLLLLDIETPINAYDTWLTGASMSLFLIVLRWFTIVSLLFLIMNPFFKLKNSKLIVSSISLVLAILNLVFFKDMILIFTGEVDLFGYRSIQFIVELALVLAMSSLNITKYLKEYNLPKAKEFINALGLFLLSSIALIPQSTFYNVFGNIGEIPEEWNDSHVFIVGLPILFAIVSYAILKDKSQEKKNFFITFIVFASFFQYFSYPHHGLNGLPLHLCNMAIVLMLCSILFRWKGFFYFNYFANVLGALAALLFPDISGDLFSTGAMRYLFNHWYVFTWPILAVALGTFGRPKLNDMIKAIRVFSVYYFLIVIINAWFNNYQSVDYFFTYGNHISDMFGLTGLQYGHVLEFEFRGLTFTFYWLFQIIYYFAFIFLMFISWYIYDGFFSFSDRQKELRAKQNKILVDELKFQELLDGRSPEEPINPGGIDMIKIKNFSKKYGHSEKYAVKDFSLEVKKGEVFGFLGHNGAGKSTTIKSLVGIQSITEGEMEICGYSIKTQPLEAKLQIGYVSDNHALYEKLTGREYIQYVCDLYKVDYSLRDERLDKLLEKFNLSFAIDQEIKSYSHGMKQKLVVVAALIHEPPVWILDEPLTGLDPTSSYQIKESMREHANKGNIVFFSSHVIEVVEKICDKIAIITNGKLQGIYDMEEVRKNNISLEELYMSKIGKDEVEAKYD